MPTASPSSSPIDRARGVALAVWELPQNLLGLGLLALCRVGGRVVSLKRERGRLFVEVDQLGVSLGWFVFWCRDLDPMAAAAMWTREHEYGHTLQSRMFGPLYLLVVGIPSVSRVAYAWWRHRVGRPWHGYYDGWPEKQADQLAGVDRSRAGGVQTWDFID